MPGKRDPSQTTITVSMSKRFLDAVDDACHRFLRGAPRAQIVRDALQDYLKHKHGLIISDEDVLPPARVMDKKSSAPLPPRKGDVVYEKKKRAKKKP